MEFIFLILFLICVVIAYLLGRFISRREIKEHRKDAVMRSRAVLSGNFSEQLAPFLPGFNFSPTECRFIGKPVDFIVFKGIDNKKIDEVVFVEVKSGSSKLNDSERSLKETIERKRVRWEEYRVDEDLTRG